MLLLVRFSPPIVTCFTGFLCDDWSLFLAARYDSGGYNLSHIMSKHPNKTERGFVSTPLCQ